MPRRFWGRRLSADCRTGILSPEPKHFIACSPVSNETGLRLTPMDHSHPQVRIALGGVLLEETSIGSILEIVMEALHRPANSCPDAVQILMIRVSLENPTPCLIGSREWAWGGDCQTFTNTQSVESPPLQRPIAPGGPGSLFDKRRLRNSSVPPSSRFFWEPSWDTGWL